MALGLGNRIIRSTLFFFNLLWLIVGALLVIGGTLIYTKTAFLIKGFENIQISNFAIGLIVIGVITFIISFCGCCGAFEESRCMTLTYSILVSIVLLTEVSIVIFVFVKYKNNTLETEIFNNMQKIFDKNQTIIIDLTQKYLKCCGVTGIDYWQNGTIPVSCCPGKVQCNDYAYFTKGCAKVAYEFFIANKNIIEYSVLGFVIMELLLSVFSYILSRNVD